jgi:hypothetical protein
MVLPCRYCRWHIRCPSAVSRVQVSVLQGVSLAVQEAWASLVLLRSHQELVSQRLVQVVGADVRQLAVVEVALV